MPVQVQFILDSLDDPTKFYTVANPFKFVFPHKPLIVGAGVTDAN